MLSPGIDVVSIERIERASKRRAFLERVYTQAELKESFSQKKPERYLAGRFALKEALIKALGGGKGAGLRMKDLEFLTEEGGRPKLRPGPFFERALKDKRVLSSICFAGGLAFAFVLVE